MSLQNGSHSQSITGRTREWTSWSESSSLYLSLGTAVIIFLIDLMFPRGVAIGVLYVIPILLSLHPKKPTLTLALGGLCTGLAALGYVFSGDGGIPPWMVFTNRGVSIAMIWMTVLLSHRHAADAHEIETLHALLPICASCKKIRDDQGYWSQVEQYFETHTKTVFTHSLCPHCVRKWYPELYPELADRYPELFKEA